MATPNYTTELIDITTDSDAFTAVEYGGALTTAETDFYIQGANCLSKATSATWDTDRYGGALHDDGAGRTIPSNGAVFAWIYFWGSAALATEANGGYAIAIGPSSTAYKTFEVRGSNTWEFGGWECVPVDPDTFWASPHRTVGTPAQTYQWFGAEARVAVTVNIGKGNPFGLDAIRYGRGELRCTDGDVTNGYASFGGSSPDTGAAAYDNAVARRWGLLTPRNGAFFQQGLFVMGLAATAVDFRDSNRVVFIQNTKKVASAFNGFEIRNALSRVDWTSISVQALGTVSRGYFTVVDNADVNLDACTFTDMGAFTFQAATSVLNCIFRRTGQITTGGATLTGCTIASNTASSAVLASSPANAALVSNTDFTSDGTGHAIEITGTAANFTLTNNTYTSYAASDGSTGNEAVYVNIATGSLTLTVSGGGTPSVRTAGCSVTVETASRTIKVAVTKIGGVVTGANVFLAAAAGGPFPSGADPDDIVTITRSGTTATVSHTAHGMANNDQVNIDGITDKIEDNNGVHIITLDVVDPTNKYTYQTTASGSTSYTGTIKSTFVFLKGEATAGTGGNEISMSRSIPSSQPVVGWARKSTSTPYYKEGAISGTVSSTGDTTFSPVLISDD